MNSWYHNLTKIAKQHKFKCLILALLSYIFLSTAINILVSYLNESKPRDAYLLLGGDVHLEIYAAQLALKGNRAPIIVSGGDLPPCEYKLYTLMSAPMKKVFLEQRSHSTFDNYMYSVPILKAWGAKKVTIITSSNRLPRAYLLAQLHLRSQGISPEEDILNLGALAAKPEYPIMTFLDILRSIPFCLIRQIVPIIPKYEALEDIDLEYWQTHEYSCNQLPKDLFQNYKHYKLR